MTESHEHVGARDARPTGIASPRPAPVPRSVRPAASRRDQDASCTADRVQCCDVLILGRGPAASAAALTATRLGLCTVMMAPRRPLVPTPAELVPAGFASALARIGVRQRAICRQGRFTAAGRDTLAGWHVDRTQLDLLLLRAAVRGGAQLRHEAPEAPIQENGRIGGVVCAGGLVRSRVLIDASGSAAWLRRSLGLRRTALSDPLIAARGQVRGMLPFLGEDGMRFTAHPSGWTLMIAHEGLVSWTVLCTDGQRPDTPAALALLPKTIPVSHAAVGWQLTRPVAGDGWLIAGDAGGRVDPAGGSGLSDALASGARAAHAAGLCLQGDGPTVGARIAYDDWFTEMITQRATELGRRYEAHGIRLDRHPMRRRAA